MVSLSRVALLAVMTLLVGCASTKQARSMEQAGFLGDLAPLMQKGKEGEALLVYKSPRIALIPRGTYKKMLLEPVTLWGPPAAEQRPKARRRRWRGLPSTHARSSATRVFAHTLTTTTRPPFKYSSASSRTHRSNVDVSLDPR